MRFTWNAILVRSFKRASAYRGAPGHCPDREQAAETAGAQLSYRIQSVKSRTALLLPSSLPPRRPVVLL